jgi:uncharacterized protein YbjT (DUF2867 family)
MVKVLVTGAKGFIGKSLINYLLSEGEEVWALKRKKSKVSNKKTINNYHEIIGDMNFFEQLSNVPQNIDVAFYFLHSLAGSSQDLIQSEKKVAFNFLKLLKSTNCRQIIYLSGIVEDNFDLSPHLKSRYAVEEVLKESGIPLTTFRSSIIIGSGSASFEIIRDLVEKLPFMVAPKWVKNYCQPIAIYDVLYYLVKAILNKNCFNKTYDIGGPESLSFEDLLLRYAKFRKLKRYILNIPFLTPRLSSYWLYFITNVNFFVCRHLIDSMKHSTRKFNLLIDSDIPHKTLDLEKALALAFQNVEQNKEVARKKETYSPDKQEQYYLVDAPKQGVNCLSHTINIGESTEIFIKRKFDFEKVNKFFSTKKINIFKKHAKAWQIIYFNKDRKKVILHNPLDHNSSNLGQGWIEYTLNEEKRNLNCKLIFRPVGLKGRLYWYLQLFFNKKEFIKISREWLKSN